MKRAELARRIAERAPAVLQYLDRGLRTQVSSNRYCHDLLASAPADLIGRMLAQLVDARLLQDALWQLAQGERGEAAGLWPAPPRPEEDVPALPWRVAAPWEWDLVQQGVRYSPQFKALLGYAEPGLPPDFTFFSALHPEDERSVFDAIALAIQDAGAFHGEFRMRCADGAYRWLRARGAVSRSPDSGIPLRLRGLVCDISTRKRAEMKLGRTQAFVGAALDAYHQAASDADERRQLARVRRAVAAVSPAGTRAPLLAIGTALERLGEAKALPRATQQFVGLALRNAQRVACVVEQWLNLEALELGHAPLRLEPVEISEVVHSLCAQHGASAQARGVAVEAPLPAAAWASADAACLRQTVLQLLLLALERSPAGSRVRLHLEAGAGTLALRLQDDGLPLPGRAPLGLAVSKLAAERMGGTLHVASRPAGGMLFHLRLPRAASPGSIVAR